MSVKSQLANLLRRHRSGARWLALRALKRHSQLESNGWFESFQRGLPVDGQGQPIPWYTYPAIRFLEQRVQPGSSVFEYGSGHSTMWWSRHAASVTSCEHDRAWFDFMRARLPASVNYIHAEAVPDGPYAAQVAATHRQYDVIVIDGRERVRCAEHAAASLAPGGVIVWDNSDRPDYQQGYDLLSTQGFRRIDFWGMGPINTYEWCTSVFYRSDNCLGI